MLAGSISNISTVTIHGQGTTEVVFRRRGVLFRLLRVVLFAAAWLFGLMFGVVLMGAGDGGTAWFLPVWLALWGLGGLVFLAGLLWSALGVESLIARSESLTLMRRLLILRSPVVVPAGTITEIRWSPDNPNHTVRVNGRRIPQTGIEIVADDRVLRCARGIGEAQAAATIAELRQRLVVGRRQAR